MAEFTPPAFGTPGRGAGGQFAKGNVFGQGALGFGVGIPEFLDSQESKVARYYRGLEFGSIKFVGTRIFGLFGTGSRLDFKGGELFAPGRGTGQQFFPLGYISGFLPGGGTATAKALRYLRENGGSKTHGSNLEVLIKNPIEAQNAYRDAFKSFDAPEKEKAAVLQILGGLINGENARWRRGMSKGSLLGLAGPSSSQQFRDRGGFMSGGALSGYTGSLARIDATLRQELTQVNRLLAQGLAYEVASLQQKAIKRPGTESGRLIDATTDPRNRFPS